MPAALGSVPSNCLIEFKIPILTSVSVHNRASIYINDFSVCIPSGKGRQLFFKLENTFSTLFTLILPHGKSPLPL
jgi:hypothetical protein